MMDSPPLPSRRTPTDSAWAWAWLSFILALLVTIALIWRTWAIVGPNTYQGGDGKSWQTLIRTVIEFAPAFHLNILNPLQGAAGFGSPINVWVNPVYWPFFWPDPLFATQASTALAYAALTAALFVLSRVWRLPLGASIAGSLSSLIVFPPFSSVSGFATLLTIVPDAAMGATLMIITATISYRMSDLRWRTLASGALLLVLWLGYVVYSSPSWFVGAGFIFLPLIAFSILDAGSAPLIAARGAAFAIAFALLYVTGPLDYVRTLFAYSSRIYFPSEWTRPQVLPYASWVFESPRLLWTYLFLLAGWAAGLIFGDRRERKAILACLGLFAVFLVEGSVYLFAPIHWPATLPVYYEVLMGPVYVLGAIVGYSSLLATMWRKLPARPPSTAAAIRVIRAVPALSGIAFVPLLGAWYVTGEIHAHKYTPNVVNTLTEPWPAIDELDAYLGAQIGLRNTRRFRGTALMDSFLIYENFLVVTGLWRSFVPTMNTYGIFDMPRFNYFVRHLPPAQEALPLARVRWTDADLNASAGKILQALGVRYVLRPRPDGVAARIPPDDAVLRFQSEPMATGGTTVSLAVYEYQDPNVGSYSPTTVMVERDAPSILRSLWRRSFDPRQSIVLSERIEGPLVQASGGTMSFERGAIRVQAESRGRSLLLLPLQYSHCLVLSEPTQAKLLSANFIQTAVLFQGSIDLRISLEYGVFRPGCRRQDLADLAALGIFDEKDAGAPRAELHPHAASTLADVPRAVAAVVKKLATSQGR